MAETECWEWHGTKLPKGYGTIRHNGKMRYVHRMAWEIVNGPIPEGWCVCHHCDNPGCFNPSHLFIGTHSDNMRDCGAKGRHPGPGTSGESHSAAKLNNSAVRVMRYLYDRGQKRIVDLARAYGCSWSNVAFIVKHHTWKGLT